MDLVKPPPYTCILHYRHKVLPIGVLFRNTHAGIVGQMQCQGADMTRLSPGQSVVEALRAEGISYVFGIVGGTFLEVLDALYDAEDIKFVSVRHEQGAAFMADGFARASGQPAVCLVTNGPGATNLVSGVYAAYTGHSPVISISGAPSRDVVYRDAFQETDHVSLFRPVTKQALSVNAADRIPELFRHAFRTAMTGKRGPVFIDIPRDLLGGAQIEHPNALAAVVPGPPATSR